MKIIDMKLKNDKYKKARGGSSRLLEITCAKCDSLVCRYQKDGPGNLRRMYVDRISDSKVILAEKSLNCPDGHLLAMKIIYAKESRPTFRLIAETIKKKIIK